MEGIDLGVALGGHRQHARADRFRGGGASSHGIAQGGHVAGCVVCGRVVCGRSHVSLPLPEP